MNDLLKQGDPVPLAWSPTAVAALLRLHSQAAVVVDTQGHCLLANEAASWLAREGDLPSLRELGVPSPVNATWRAAIAEGRGWTGSVALADTAGVMRTVAVEVLPADPSDRARICLLKPAAAPSESAATEVMRLQAAAETAPVMIWMSDVDGRSSWFNATWLTYTGRAPAEVLGDAWLELVHPEDTERCVAIYRTSFDERQPFSMDYRLRRHDGAYRWVMENGVPRHSGHGQFEGYIGSCIDIHERKELEERLAAHAQSMRLADRRQNEFLAMLSHQLRSPLAPIANAASVLRTLDGGNPTVVRLREIIERQVGRLRRLVDDLVDVTRVMQGQITLVKGRVAVTDLLRSAVETSQPKLDAAGHTLRMDLPPAPLWVTGDSVRLAQALSNILTNAATFTSEPSVISVSTKVVEGSLFIAVRDEGQGITAEFLPYVFDLFSRHDLQSGGSHGGLGLGLPLARRVAQLHGGDVKAYSEGVGQGAEFVLSLPLAPADTSAQNSTAPAAPALASYRVLLIEENPDTRYLMRLQIELWGHQVATSGTVEESLRLIDGFRPEVVLCDIEAREASRPGAVAALRERLADAVFVALSAYGHREGEANAKSLGFDVLLVKPLRPDALGRLVEPHIKRSAVTG